MRLIIIFLFLAFSLQAFTLEWDDEQSDMTYRIYEKTGDQWAVVATTTNKRYSMTAPTGIHIYSVTANNQYGESPKSNEASVTIPPNAPKNFRIIIDAEVRIEQK
jgi:hypothetical protein